MSRSNPHETLTNPASKFYKWDSDNACFSYFDKTLGEKDAQGKAKGQNVLVPLPFNFLVLDTLACVRGYNEPQEKSYYSNEVRNLTTDIITVKANKQVEKIGLYAEVKTLNGAKYCQSVYIGYKNTDGKLEIQNIQLTGAALNSWIEFCKSAKINEIAVSVKSSVQKKKGRNTYNEPVYTAIKINEKTNQEAIELDKELQIYLTAYLAKNASAPAAAPTTNTTQETANNTRSTISNEQIEEDKNPVTTFNPDLDDDLPF
jgi:hypothetical protein